MARIVFCFLLLISWSVISVSAQNHKIDSMKRLLPVTSGTVEKFDLLRGLAVQYFKIDKDTSLQYVDEVIKLIPNIQDSVRIVKAYMTRGFLLFHLGRYRELISFLNKGLSIARRNKIDSEMTIILNLIGNAYTYIGEYGQALRCLLEAITVRLATSSGIDLDLLHNNVGLVYYKLKNNGRALEHYHKALRLQNVNKWQDPEILYINIGLCYCELGDYDKALGYINQGLSKCINNCGYVVVSGQFALGMTKSRMDDFASSELHFDSSLRVARNINDTRFIAENLVYLARVYHQTDRYHLARQALHESETIAMQHGYNEILLNVYKSFIDGFRQAKNYHDLSRYYYKYGMLREKLYGQELLQSVAAFQIDLEHHENVRTLAQQDRVAALRSSALLRQRELYYGLAFVIVLLAVVVVLVSRQLVVKRKMSKLLAKRVEMRSIALTKKQQQLEQTQGELVALINPVFNGIKNNLAYLLDVNPQKISGDTAHGQYKEAIHNTLIRINKLVNTANETNPGRRF